MCLFRPSCGVPPPTQFLPTHDGTGLGWHTDVHYVKKNFSAHIYKIGMGHSWFIWVGHYSTFLSLLVSFPDPRLLLLSNQWSGNETIYSIHGQNDVQRGQAYGCQVESRLLLPINCTKLSPGPKIPGADHAYLPRLVLPHNDMQFHASQVVAYVIVIAQVARDLWQ